ncbi:MAG: hypothetical protein AB2785_04740 [Candidatus Thiodiazotropha endolucinida]
MEVKRTKGITVLSLLLGWLSLAGFGNSYIMMSNSGYGSPAFGIGAAAYGILAFAACVGLWKMKRWGYTAYLLWAAAVIALSFLFQFTVDGIPIWQFALFVVIVGAALAGIARYIRRVQQNAL